MINAVIAAVGTMLVLSLSRVHVVIAIIVGALVGGLTGGLGAAAIGLPLVFVIPAAFAAVAVVGLLIMSRRESSPSWTRAQVGRVASRQEDTTEDQNATP